VYEFLAYRVKHVMTPDPVAVRPQTPLRDVEATFAERGFGVLPVTDPDGRLVAVVSNLDLFRAFAFTTTSKLPRYDEVTARPVEEVMTRGPEALAPDLPLTRAMQTMIDTRFRALPVVEDRRLVGMVARTDVMGALRRAAEGHGPEADAPA